MVTIDKDQKALQNVHNALKDSKAGLNTRRLGMGKHASTLDVDTIKKSNHWNNEQWEEDNKLRELQPLGNDTQVAILIIKHEQNKILEEGFLRVVLVKCRIEKKLHVM